MSNVFCRSKFSCFHGLVATAMVAMPMTVSAASPPEDSYIPSDFLLWDTFAPLGEPERQPGETLEDTRTDVTFESGSGYLASDHDWRFTEDQTVELNAPTSSGSAVAAPWLDLEDEFDEFADHRILQSHARVEMTEDTRFSTIGFGTQDVRFFYGSVRFQVEPAENEWRIQVAEDQSTPGRERHNWYGDLDDIETELNADSTYNMGFEVDTLNLTATGSVNGEILFEDLDLTKGGEVDFGRVVFDWDDFRNAHFGIEQADEPGAQLHEIGVNIIPEPASLGLVGLGSLLLVIRRRVH